jgi:hypothetical protein
MSLNVAAARRPCGGTQSGPIFDGGKSVERAGPTFHRAHWSGSEGRFPPPPSLRAADVHDLLLPRDGDRPPRASLTSSFSRCRSRGSAPVLTSHAGQGLRVTRPVSTADAVFSNLPWLERNTAEFVRKTRPFASTMPSQDRRSFCAGTVVSGARRVLSCRARCEPGVQRCEGNSATLAPAKRALVPLSVT